MWPDTRYRWVIVGYTIVLQAVNVGILTYCFALFTLPWIDEFGASRRDIMITMAALQVGMGLLSPFIGRYMDKFPMRNIVLAGLSALVIGLWLCTQVTALWHLWVIYATFMPLSTAMMGTLASQTLVAKWFSDKRGLALGISAMGTNVGGLLFPPLVALLILDYGWRDTVNTLVVICLVVVLPLTFLVLRRQPPSISLDANSNSANPVAAEKIWTTTEILTTVRFWLPFAALTPLTMGFGALQFNLGTMVRDLGLADETAAWLISLSALAMVSGKLFFGSFGDRIDHRYLYWFASVMMCFALILMLDVNSLTQLVVVVIAMGISGGGILPLMGLIFGALFGAASFGRVMGIVMLNILIGAFAPVLAGWSFDATASYDLFIYGLFIVTIPGMIAMVKLPKPVAVT